jgi:ADP-ribosyl-[dinitrogen reductase] hydrolase
MSPTAAQPTHIRLATDACRYYGALIAAALNGVSKQVLLRDDFEPAPGFWQSNPLSPATDQVAGGSYKMLNPPEINGSGYVVKSMEAALWAIYHSDSFEEGCLKAVNLGDDADTTGAIYGQLAGAIYGEKRIPSGLLEKLAKRDLIEDFAEKLYYLSNQSMP